MKVTLSQYGLRCQNTGHATKFGQGWEDIESDAVKTIRRTLSSPGGARLGGRVLYHDFRVFVVTAKGTFRWQ